MLVICHKNVEKLKVLVENGVDARRLKKTDIYALAPLRFKDQFKTQEVLKHLRKIGWTWEDFDELDSNSEWTLYELYDLNVPAYQFNIPVFSSSFHSQA